MSQLSLSTLQMYGVLVGVAVGTFLVSLDVSVIGTAIPAITSSFHSTTDIGWYATAYPLAMCSLQPLSGKILTIFPLRWAYLGFFLVFLLGSLLCGTANGSNMFIVGRAVAGAGGAGVVTGGLSVLSLVSPAEQRPLLTGLAFSLYSLGTVVAPLIGGAFTERVSWRWCFLVNLPAGAVTIMTLLIFFRPPRTEGSTEESTDEDRNTIQRLGSLDLFGCGLFIPTVLMVLLALEWGGHQYTWSSPTIIGLFVGSGPCLALFVLWELRMGDSAMVPLRLFRRQSIALSIIFTFLFVGSAIVPVFYLPEWFQVIKEADPIRSGIMLLPSVMTQIFGAIASGFLAKYTRYYNPWFFLGSAFLSTATGLYTTFTAFSTPSAKWIGFQVLQGLGCGFAGQMSLLNVQNILQDDSKQVPIAISAVLFAQYFGSAVMQSVSSVIFQNMLHRKLISDAHLNSGQVALLLEAGTLKVRETTMAMFPDRVNSIMSSYNGAIVSVFYLAIAGSGLAFLISLGIEWTAIGKSRAPEEPIHEEGEKGP